MLYNDKIQVPFEDELNWPIRMEVKFLVKIICDRTKSRNVLTRNLSSIRRHSVYCSAQSNLQTMKSVLTKQGKQNGATACKYKQGVPTSLFMIIRIAYYKTRDCFDDHYG